MGKELDTVNELIKLSWDVLDLNMSGAGFLGLWYFALRLLQGDLKSLCLVQELSLSHSPCVSPRVMQKSKCSTLSWIIPG